MSHKLPNGWTAKTLGELFEFKNGFNADKSMYGKGKKFINVMEVINKQSLCERDIPGQVDIPDDSFSHYSVVKGDVLFNRTSETPDEIGLTAVYLDDKPVTFGGFVIRARPLGKDLDTDFCKYCFSASVVRKEIIKRGQGAIRSNIGQGDLSDVLLQIPSKDEQEKIAKMLSIWDRAIEKLDRQIFLESQILAQIIATIFSEDSNDLAFEQVFVVANEKSKQLKSADYLDQGQFPIVDQGKSLICGFTNDLSKIIRDVPLIVFGDHTREIKFIDFEFAPGADGTQLLKTIDAIDVQLGYYALKSVQIPNLGYARHFKEVKKARFKIPKKENQAQATLILSTQDRKISVLENYRRSLVLQKHGLMQQLLNGKKRVKV